MHGVWMAKSGLGLVVVEKRSSALLKGLGYQFIALVRYGPRRIKNSDKNNGVLAVME